MGACASRLMTARLVQPSHMRIASGEKTISCCRATLLYRPSSIAAALEPSAKNGHPRWPVHVPDLRGWLRRRDVSTCSIASSGRPAYAEKTAHYQPRAKLGLSARARSINSSRHRCPRRNCQRRGQPCEDTWVLIGEPNACRATSIASRRLRPGSSAQPLTCKSIWHTPPRRVQAVLQISLDRLTEQIKRLQLYPFYSTCKCDRARR